MNALITTELLKLRTTCWPLALLPCAVALTVAVALSAVINAGTDGAPSIGTTGALLSVLAASRLGALFALMAGALAFTGEVRRGTLTAAILQSPHRVRFLAAKAAAVAAFTLVIGLCDLLAVLTVGLASGALDSALINGDIVLRAAGLTAAYPAYGLLGVGVGALLVHQPLVVVLPAAWYLFLEDLLVPADSTLRPWTLANISAAVANAGDIAGLVPGWAGALVLAGYALTLTALGTIRLVLSDIT